MAENPASVRDEESLPTIERLDRRHAGDPRNRTSTISCQLIAERSGWMELFSFEVWRASVAELIGTTALVFALDSIIISSSKIETTTPNLVIPFLVFLSVTVLIIATAPISGGHLNPVITFSAALMGLISLGRAGVYILAQCAGGVLGALLLKAVIDDSTESSFSLGGCTLTVVVQGPDGPMNVGIELGPALWLEIICTFIFLFTSVSIAFDRRQARAIGIVIMYSIIGAVVGLMVFLSSTVTAKTGYSGAAMNPARCIGPAIVRGGHLWERHWVFWVGSIIASLAFSLYIKIIPRQHLQAH